MDGTSATKYVAYFFGEIEDEDEENINKRQHSRLLIIRLILLIGGYLLAVLASGIPLDKISIIIASGSRGRIRSAGNC